MSEYKKKLTEAEMRENFRKWSAKMRAGHAELGEFIVEFSQLEFTIRASLGNALKLPDDLSNIVLSLYDFASLCKVWQLVMLHQQPKRTDEIKAIFKSCMDINSERVRVAHGLWSIAPETIEAIHVSRNSLKVETYFAEAGELRRLSSECQRLLQAVVGFGL